MFHYLKQKNKNGEKRQAGFTILVAVVTAGILLIIAMSIGGIALKEQVLSTANKESQVAFYAADTGMECATYWDLINGAFSPIIDSKGNVTGPKTGVSIKCNSNDVPIVPSLTNGQNTYIYTFLIPGLPVDGSVKTCAVVAVYKDFTDPSQTKTTIKSYGYNTCDASLTRLERGIVATY